MRLPFLAVMLVLLSGCASLITDDLRSPDVTIADLRLVEPGLLEQTFEVRLKVHNPNDVALDVDGLRFELEIADAAFARGLSNTAFVVPRLGSAEVPVTVYVSTRALIERTIELGNGGSLNYQLTGDVFLNNALVRTLSFEHDGAIDLPLPALGSPATPA